MKRVPLDAHTASTYAGLYREGDTQSRVTLSGDSLMLSRVGSTRPPSVMVYQGNGEFVPDPEYPGYRFVFEIKAGRPIAIKRFESGWFLGVRRRIE